ncbi:MAG: penicillin-binding protein [Crocinitomicaceae bacterium]|nr:penicillin-binding protein [Crocinitomicaceae bacterium]|tara:strand:+ start:11371 stop:13467 length:2097 start_codon:yes stop_codon:yes gene_type:complete
MARIGKLSLKILLLSGIIIGILIPLLWNGHLLHVPSRETIKGFRLPEASEIYTSDGVLLGKIYSENRKIISIEDIPNDLINCLIATEDNRFHEHNGVDWIGLIRVGIKTILMGEHTGGGSTITQQLVKNRHPRVSYEYNFLPFHKIREWITAVKMENIYSKEQILVHYLNTVPFGHNTFGVHTAAKYYFNKLPSELQVHEMAVLIGMLKGTTQYDPQRNPKGCLTRRNLVLKNMHQQGHLTNKQYRNAIETELSLTQNSFKLTFGSYFLQHIITTVKEMCGPSGGKLGLSVDPNTDGLKIYTTIDSRVQLHAESALYNHMDSLQLLFNEEWSEERWREEKSTLIKLLQLKKHPGYESVGEALESNNSLTIEEDSMLKKMKTDLTSLRAGFTCIKNSGEVLAWVGGRDFSYSQYDHVKGTRQVGSVFKPIVYVTAVDQGVNICNYFKNEKISYSQFHDWQPRNASDRYQGAYTMKGALTWSLNVISVQVMLRAGLRDVLNVAKQMGIRADLPEVGSISLGTPDISLYDVVNAYTCFPNDGKRVHTKYLSRIQLPNGKVIYSDETHNVEELFTTNVAATMTNMMESVVNRGTASALRTEYGLAGPIAGKTGTSQNQSDGWFVGYTPQVTAGAWVGADSPEIHFKSLEEGAGSKTALPIWAGFAKELQNDPELAYLLEGEFTQPSRKAMRCLNQPMYRPKF